MDDLPGNRFWLAAEFGQREDLYAAVLTEPKDRAWNGLRVCENAKDGVLRGNPLLLFFACQKIQTEHRDPEHPALLIHALSPDCDSQCRVCRLTTEAITQPVLPERIRMRNQSGP
jgi:hypothetical protein